MKTTMPKRVRYREDLPAGHWLARQLPKGASLRTYAEERSIISLTTSIQTAIEASGLSRAEIAAVLGCSRAFVSQILNGSSNMTLKTLGALLWAIGQQVQSLQLEPLGSKKPGEPCGEVLAFRVPTLATSRHEVIGAETQIKVVGI